MLMRMEIQETVLSESGSDIPEMLLEYFLCLVTYLRLQHKATLFFVQAGACRTKAR